MKWLILIAIICVILVFVVRNNQQPQTMSYEEGKQAIRQSAGQTRRELPPLDPNLDLRVPRSKVNGLSKWDITQAVMGPTHTYLAKGYELWDLNLTPGQIAIYIAEYGESQVNNGGFDQFFFNSSGNYAHDLPDAFRRIGATRKAALAEQALAVFPQGNCPRDREKRWEAMDNIPESDKQIWDTIDDQYYDIDEEVYDLGFKYVSEHQQEFFLD